MGPGDSGAAVHAQAACGSTRVGTGERWGRGVGGSRDGHGGVGAAGVKGRSGLPWAQQRGMMPTGCRAVRRLVAVTRCQGVAKRATQSSAQPPAPRRSKGQRWPEADEQRTSLRMKYSLRRVSPFEFAAVGAFFCAQPRLQNRRTALEGRWDTARQTAASLRLWPPENRRARMRRWCLAAPCWRQAVRMAAVAVATLLRHGCSSCVAGHPNLLLCRGGPRDTA